MAIRVLQASNRFDLDRVLGWINSSHIERETGVITLFMCTISPSCEIPELLLNRQVTRVEVPITTGALRIWLFEFTPDRPDIVIEEAYVARKIRSTSGVSEP